MERPSATRDSVVFGILRFLLLAAATWATDAPAQLPGPTQYDVQSVYLFDFAKFVRWPAGTEHNAISICIAGPKVYADSLTRIVAGERVDGRPLRIHSLQSTEMEDDCDILFIGAAARDRMDPLLTAAATKPILTVSDIPGFLERGGMIQLMMVDNRVRFSVNLRSVSRSGLSLSSEFLKVAMKVTGAGKGGGGR